MKYFIFTLTLVLKIAFSTSIGAQTSSSTDSLDYFLPERDPILSTINGRARFMVSEEVLVRAADLRFAKLGAIETIYKKEIEGQWFVYIECRLLNNIQESAIVAVKLRQDDNGNYFADHSWNACIGSSCGSCSWQSEKQGCFCMTDKPGEPGEPGFCYNIWSNDPLFRSTLLKAP